MEQVNYSLLKYNTFGIDVKAARFLEYASTAELLELIGSRRIKTPFLHIGQGSNLLFTQDYQGTVLHSRIKGVFVEKETANEVDVCVGAAELWDDFVAFCVDHNWYGSENLSLIPGEVGAAAVQNIGAYGVEVKDLITSVDTIDSSGFARTFQNKECGYAYRKSCFKQPDMKQFFVTHVHFKLSKIPHFDLDYGSIRKELGDIKDLTLQNVRSSIIAIRQSKLPDPAVVGNAGSFFMNPVVEHNLFDVLHCQYPDMPFYELPDGKIKIPAGWMIEQCGWKGKALGPVAVFSKQALILVNLGGAKGNDVVRLSDTVRRDVKSKFGIDIHPEVNFI